MKRAPSDAAPPAIFTFKSNYPVRVVPWADDHWFVATDIAKVLGYRDAADMVRMLDDDEKGTHIVRTPSGWQDCTVISESGVFACILRSRRPEAKAFRKWVTSEVLPALRRTGTYTLAARPPRHPGAERLNASDMANLRRAVWRVACGQFQQDVWVRTAWKCLRRAVGADAGDPFLVEHLPLLVDELRRLCVASDGVTGCLEVVSDAAIERLLLGGHVGDVASLGSAALSTSRPKPDRTLVKWAEREFDRLAKRETAVMDHLEVAEVD